MSSRRGTSGRIKEALGLPKHVGWSVPMPQKLLESAALQVLPARSLRVLFGLMTAFAGDGGKTNGRFMAPYDALAAHGVWRETVLDGLVDLQAVGLIAVNRGARSYGTRRHPSRYRLTWLGTPDGLGPTNEWLAIKTIEEAETRLANARVRLAAERAEKRERRAERQQQNVAAEDRTNVA